MGAATRVKFRLAERLRQWPFAGGPATLTAAQALALVEGLRDLEKDSGPGSKPKGKRLGPKLSREKLAKFAAAHGVTVTG